MNTYICRYCRQPSDPDQATCPLCGAPVDVRSVVSDAGWVEQPPIRDMARLQFGQSHCQIAGTTVPVAEFNLSPNDWMYFSHHVLLWTDTQAQLSNMSMRGGWKRMMAGLPLIMVEARGPGHLALSDNHAGEVVALPLQHGQQMWVREHRFLCATGNISYDWTSTDVWYVTGQDRDDEETHYPMGQFGDVFTARDAPGLLLLHAPGNTFIRDLQPGQSLLIQPSSLLYRDVSVRLNLHLEYPRNRGFAFWSNRWSYRNIWVRLHGPGRVAVQSVYEPPEDTEVIRRHSHATTHHW
ncbi:MAG TPA: AIM24 family protein [Streptosporangiaceae bacterium]|nr:AIM24 family protein [Streptosporangiaceae bacterium]